VKLLLTAISETCRSKTDAIT